MKTLMVALAAAGFLVASVSVNSLCAQQTDPQPTCRMCEGTYLPATEIQDYLKKALAEKRTDQQARRHSDRIGSRPRAHARARHTEQDLR